MPEAPPTCPQCARPIPAGVARGLCPACLVASVFELGAEEVSSPASVQPPPARPSERIGNYELLEQLGRGGMGVVFRARDLRLQRIVALKLLLTGKLASDVEVKRFRTEAGAAAGLEHPNIVPIYEVGEAEGRAFFTMKFIESGSLAEPLRRTAVEGRPLPTAVRAAQLLGKVARAVHFAHQHGILHRDLKPANILLSESGEPFVCDFGLARLMEAEGSITGSGDVLGTPGYLAPEVAVGGSREATTASDIYSLGAILYELMAGRPPFAATTVPALLRMIAEEEPVPPGRVRARDSTHRLAKRTGASPASAPADRDLETICLKCLAKDPAGRYTSARALAEDLDRWLEGKPIQARPAGLWEQAAKWARRKPASALVVLCLLLLPAVIISSLLAANFRVSRARAQTRLNLYAADMQVAQTALEDANLPLARQILDAYRPSPGEPDLRGFEWRHLWQRARSGQLRVLRAHSQPVLCVAFSPDGQWLVSSEAGRTAWFWNTTTWKPERVIDWSGPSTSQFRCLSFSRDGKSLVISRDDQYSPIFDEDTLQSRWCLISRPPERGVTPRGLWSPVSDQFAFLAEAPGGSRFLAVLDWQRFLSDPGPRHADPYAGLIFESKLADSGSFPQAPIARLPDADVLHNFTPDGHLLAGRGGELVQYDLERGGEPAVIHSAHKFDYCEASRDGRFLAGFNSLPKDRHSVLLDEFAPGRTDFWEMIAHDGEIRALAISPDSRRIVTGSADHTARVWDSVTRKSVATLRGHGDEVSAVAWSPDGQLIATGSKDRTVMVWSVSATNQTDGLPEPVSGAFAPWLVSTTGGALAASTKAGGAGRLQVWDFTRGEAVELVGSEGAVPVFLMEGGRRLLGVQGSARGGFELRAWKVAGGTDELLAKLPSPGPRTANLIAPVWAMSPDARWLARSDVQGSVDLWPVGAPAEPASVLPATGQSVTLLAFAPRGELFAVAHADASGHGTVTTWLLNGSPQRGLARSLPGPVNAMAWAPDGSGLALACDDHRIELWDGRNSSTPREFLGHKRGVTDVAFSPDGCTLASADGRTIKLWHTATGREMLTIYRDLKIGEPVRWLAFTPDGTRLLAADESGRVQIFLAPPLAGADRPEDSAQSPAGEVVAPR